MNACGHNSHISIQLIASKILANHRDEIKGNIKFVFQPNEEDAGGERMIEECVQEDPKVDAKLGLHIWSQLETEKLAIVE